MITAISDIHFDPFHQSLHQEIARSWSWTPPFVEILLLLQAVSQMVTQWQQRQIDLLPEAAANVSQMAQLARSGLDENSGVERWVQWFWSNGCETHDEFGYFSCSSMI